MRSFAHLTRPEVVLSAVLVATLAGSLVVARDASSDICPPGTAHIQEQDPALLRAQLPPELQTANIGRIRDAAGKLCAPLNGLENPMELALRDLQQRAIYTAPFDSIAPGARENAIAQRSALAAQASEVPGAEGTFEKYGVGPLDFANPDYDGATGIVDSTGRIDDYKYDAATGRLFAAVGTGGIWMSEDRGYTWRPVSDSLATQTVSAIAYTSAGGPDGTLVAVTGEHTFGGGSFLGLGVYHSRNLGLTWTKSSGPIDGTFGFAAEVDPNDPNVIYAATGKGLWRSADAGTTFTDVVLPVGPCEGDYNARTCNFSHFVTDVVVKAPGGVGADPESEGVLAVVGWRAGRHANPDGSIQSEGNGMYFSPTGQPGSFEYLPGLGDAIDGGQARIGRVEMGIAYGEAQDHDYVYAIVQDAVLLSGGDDVGMPGDLGLGTPTVLNGVYFTPDFGVSWELLADNDNLSRFCAANQSVYCIPGLIEPGAQSWYNQWIAVDPTVQAGGVPSRLIFGLEEVWSTRDSRTPKNNRATAQFSVIGAYYGSADCLLVATDCAANGVKGTTTTHPDQHAGIFLVDENGVPEIVVGHDGGLSRQKPNVVGEFAQDNWTLTQKNGLHTLLPYSGAIANDGTVYAGLQDNGAMIIEPEKGFHQSEVYGADGVLALVDPANSLYAWESTQGGNFNVTVDGGHTWAAATPPAANKLFVTPGEIDPLDANHVVTGGRQINETIIGAATRGSTWKTVFDLGTATVPEGITPPPNQLTAVDVYGDAVYVGFCGVCDILNKDAPFQNGIATNVGGEVVPKKGTADGWHIVDTDNSLPNRYITDVAIDPYDASQRTVYATLGAYSRSWVPPGSVADANTNVGTGHVFRSTNGGQSFVDVSGDLPDTPALDILVRGDQLIVATDIGVFISSNKTGGKWAPLGGDTFPTVPVFDMDIKADDPDFLLVSSYGRGMQKYRFPNSLHTTVRRQGVVRSATATDISRTSFESSGTVVLAREDVYADGLAGAPLAYKLGAPLLLTPTASLPSHVAAEVKRLRATTAVILGGTNAVSTKVETDLRAAGIVTITRYAGTNRFETAARIATQVGGERAYVVKGNDANPAKGWEDAMSIAPAAAVQGWPILLTESGALPEATSVAIDSLNLVSVHIAGGINAVSGQVVADLEKLTEIGNRVAGSNRYATSVEAVKLGQQRGLSIDRLWLARGDAFPDALAAGPSVAATGASLLLVAGDNLNNSANSLAYLQRHVCSVQQVTILGGPKAISSFVEEQVNRLYTNCRTTTPGPKPAPAPQPGPPPPPPPARVTIKGPYDFEADAQGWTVATSGPGTWTRGGPGHASNNGFKVAPYQDLADTTLTSPAITVPAGTTIVSWWNLYDIEGGGFDEVEVQISQNGGAWSGLTANLGGKNAGYPEFSKEEASFVAAGGTFRIRFHFFSDEICSSTQLPAPGVCAATDANGWEGFFLDDVLVERFA